jgi:hypothetical protein
MMDEENQWDLDVDPFADDRPLVCNIDDPETCEACQ